MRRCQEEEEWQVTLSKPAAERRATLGGSSRGALLGGPSTRLLGGPAQEASGKYDDTQQRQR